MTGPRYVLKSINDTGRTLWALPFGALDDAEAAKLRILLAVHRRKRQHLEIVDVRPDTIEGEKERN